MLPAGPPPSIRRQHVFDLRLRFLFLGSPLVESAVAKRFWIFPRAALVNLASRLAEALLLEQRYAEIRIPRFAAPSRHFILSGSSWTIRSPIRFFAHRGFCLGIRPSWLRCRVPKTVLA